LGGGAFFVAHLLQNITRSDGKPRLQHRKHLSARAAQENFNQLLVNCTRDHTIKN